MAQHIPIEQINNEVFDRIRHGIDYDIARTYGGLRGSLKWQKMPLDYLENDDTEVFCANKKVPASLVAGGIATIEVHTKNDKTINAVYVVA